MIEELDLAHRLRELADRDEPAAAPVAEILARGRRTRAVRAAAYATGVTAVLVLGALATVGLFDAQGAAPITTSPPPSHVTLALAAQTTAQSTFRFAMTAKSEPGGEVQIRWTGAADPANGRSLIKDARHIKFVEQRRIGHRCYVLSTPDSRWQSLRCPAGPGALGTTAQLTGNPMAVLEQLKATGSATYVGRTGAGDAAVDTWQFSYTQPSIAGSTPFTSAGTATVNVATNQIANVTFKSGLANEVPDQLISFDFSGYGEPVSIVAPRTAG